MLTKITTAEEFTTYVNKARLANKNKWYVITGEINGKDIQIKGYGTWLQIFRVDGIISPHGMEATVKGFKEFLTSCYDASIK